MFNKKSLFLMLLLLHFCCTNVHAQPATLTQMATPSQLSKISALEIHQTDPDHIVMSDDTRVFSSRSFGNSWEEIFRSKNPSERVIKTLFNRHNDDRYYVLTTHAFYRVGGNMCELLYQSRDEFLTACDYDPFYHSSILLGTTRQLLVSHDNAVTWGVFSREFTGTKIMSVSFHPNIASCAFVCTDEKVFVIDTTSKRTISAYKIAQSECDVSGDVDVVDSEEEICERRTRFVFPLEDDDFVYLFKNKEVVMSADCGETWSSVVLPRDVSSGIASLDVSSRADELLLGSRRGLYRYDLKTQRMTPEVGTMPVLFSSKHEGLTKRCIMTDGAHVYHYEETLVHEIKVEDVYSVKTMRSAVAFASNEMKALPSIKTLHAHALDYAHLTENRLRSWEVRARLCSLLPTLSLDVDRDTSNNIDIDRGSTSVADTFLDGPDERDTTVGVSIEWDMADLIWNDTETTIEYRRKSFVDQRDDILHEVTRLYYEYMMLATELHLLEDIKVADEVFVETSSNYLQKVIRCQEILAQLDGITGGAVLG